MLSLFFLISNTVVLHKAINIINYQSQASTGGTARWLQLQPSSSWPRPTVSTFQYFRWCALTKLAVSHFLHQIYSPSKEEALQSLLISLSTLVFWLFDEENIRRHDGCSKWWRWLQLMFRERWRGLHDSFDELVPLITQEICFKYFWNLAGTFFRWNVRTSLIITVYRSSKNTRIMKRNSIVTFLAFLEWF